MLTEIASPQLYMQTESAEAQIESSVRVTVLNLETISHAGVCFGKMQVSHQLPCSCIGGKLSRAQASTLTYAERCTADLPGWHL